MIRPFPSMVNVLVLVAAAAFLVPCPAGAAQKPSLDLLRRATDPNPGLQSYTANAQLSATLRAVVPIKKSYPGNVYYLRPKRKIEFQGVSGPLSKFKDLVTSTPTYEEAAATYSISPLDDNGTESTYLLVPKKTGSRVKSLNVHINDRSALLDRAEWSYNDGSSLSVDQTYQNVGNFRLPAKSTIAARYPAYRVDGTLTFSGYVPNAPVAPSVFESPKP